MLQWISSEPLHGPNPRPNEPLAESVPDDPDDDDANPVPPIFPLPIPWLARCVEQVEARGAAACSSLTSAESRSRRGM